MLEPKKINSYIIIDFETGGLDCTKNPVMEFAGLAVHGVTLEEIVKYDNLVKPYDPKLYYDPRALQSNGLTVEMCQKDGIPLRELVKDICSLCVEANIYKTKTAKPILIAHNGDFDKNFFIDIFRRANVDMSEYLTGTFDPFGNFQPKMIDSIDWAKSCWADITDKQTNFKLASCCQRAGIELVDAHRAMNDVMPLTDLWRYFQARLRSNTSEVTITDGKASVHRQTFQW